MDFDTIIRVAFFVSTATAAIFFAETVYFALAAPISRDRNINRRLKALGEGLAGEQALIRLKAERGIFDLDLELIGGLRKLLIQSGLRTTFGRFIFLMVAATVLVFTAINLLRLSSIYTAAAIAIFAGIIVPIVIVRIIRNRRQTKFMTQLPEALDLIVRSLRSGHPVPVAFGLVAKELADPVGTEFGVTIDEITYGLEMPRALRNLADRVGVPDVTLLVTAVSLQATSGGNLGEVLDNISKVLRERFQLHRKVRSLSAEGRFSAYGLTILPFMIGGAIYAQNPPYYLDVWDAPIFQPVMIFLFCWQMLGLFIMYKMINFRY
jgi:tight adherence protein B